MEVRTKGEPHTSKEGLAPEEGCMQGQPFSSFQSRHMPQALPHVPVEPATILETPPHRTVNYQVCTAFIWASTLTRLQLRSHSSLSDNQRRGATNQAG